MFVRAVVKEGFNDKALLIPQRAVMRDQKGSPITWILGTDSKVEQRALVLERAVRDQWLVTSGLASGEKVIIEGLQQVRPGSEAKDVPFNDDSKPRAQLDTPPAAARSIN